ncbi:sensor histidine kinase [Opitutus terrae]|uniref:Signal transduction histidine kinase, LytS n=1 Tax=Opitutus terrae (strain DSM 11246 / JCM 15787 / PB90-1) TaxID=452637 RepID=B1ZUF1_OPITP|nr:histidine kinase [Opitutus terrae]ACB73994.1 signal transduction histidine kinase, LytS [Opitutus terrae PB90-1]
MTSFPTPAWLRRHLPQTAAPFPLRLQIGFGAVAAALLGIGYVLEHYFARALVEAPWGASSRGWDSIAWFVWLMAAPAVLVLVLRFPLTRGDLARNLPGSVVAAATLYAAVVGARFALRMLLQPWTDSADKLAFDWPTFWAFNLAALPMDFLTFGGFLAAAIAIDYYRRHCEHAEETLALRLRTAQLESDLARAELTALRGQLHPHFLFNSFNAVSTLVRQGRHEAAIETIAQLSMLLRLAMERTGQQELPLETEIDFVRRYLEIERIRFGEKLQVEISVEPEANRALVPNFLFQPLAENAIKHGISRRTVPGRVHIAAVRAADRLMLVIENDGAPQASPGAGAETRAGGVGLANTRARLEKIYGSDYDLEMIPQTDGGMRIQINLPWRASPLL